jgi:hypothetical protein
MPGKLKRAEQTATAEIVKVIAGSPTDVHPVFESIVRSAARLFDCAAGITVREGDTIDLKAIANAKLDADVLAAQFLRLLHQALDRSDDFGVIEFPAADRLEGDPPLLVEDEGGRQPFDRPGLERLAIKVEQH